MDREHVLKRLGYRAWHRGTREADYLIGGFFDAQATEWSEADVTLFERLLDEDDVDVMAWAIGTQPVPAAFEGAMMEAMRKLDYVAMPGTPASRSH